MKKFNSFLFEYLENDLQRIKETFEHEVDFHDVAQVLQYNIPVGEYKKLCGDGVWDKKCREFDPLSQKFGGPIQILGLVEKYINSFQKVLRQGYSFVFYGGNGSGKSMVALYILSSLIEDGYNGYYINFKEYMALFNKAMYGDDNEVDKKVYKFIYSCDLLILDEVGKESNTTDNVIGEFENLIKHRVSRGLPTIIVCNLPFAEGEVKTNNTTFLSKYGNSVFSILKEKFRIFNFSSKDDYREKSRKEWSL